MVNLDHDPTIEEFDAIVVLDAPWVNRIASIDPSQPILIDRHNPGNLSECATTSIMDTDAGATAELVKRVIQTGQWEITPIVALALLSDSSMTPASLRVQLPIRLSQPYNL